MTQSHSSDANRSTCLHEYCREDECGGMIHRKIVRWESPQDDTGGQICHAQVTDYCEKCGNVCRQSPETNFPCLNLGMIFEQWEAGQLDREQFDQEVVQALAQGGCKWTLEAS